MNKERTRVCPVELADSLDSRLRRLIQNPYKILEPFVSEGMKVLDAGCGPGYFSIEAARLAGSTGKVIAADLQEGMLEKLRAKIKGTGLESRITIVKCDKNKINVTEKVDFILTFYVVHEVPDKISFFKQLYDVLSDEGKYLLVEPKLFHVSKKDFELTLKTARENGFEPHEGPKLLASWSAVLKKKK